MKNLEKYTTIVLASGSPRRKELLKIILDDYVVMKSDAEENFKQTKPEDIVMELASLKAKSIKLTDALIIGADTIVVVENEILGKPKNRLDGANMLKKLSNRCHDVYTGIALFDVNCGRVVTSYKKTTLWVEQLSNEDINEYLDTNEYCDKAGGYAIQGFFSKFIKKIDGCYFNVVGLPVNELYNLLKTL